MHDVTPIVGVILAGGASSRMGGGDKTLRRLGDRPLLQRIADRMRPQVDCLILNANGEPSRFAAFGLRVVPDALPDAPGPLAGILAGMRWCREHKPASPYIATVPSDVPFLPADLVSRLSASLDTGHPVALARSAAGLQPVIGLWPVVLAGDLEQQLAQGHRKVADFAARHGFTSVQFDPNVVGARSVDPFFNTNTPEELAEAVAILAGSPDDPR